MDFKIIVQEINKRESQIEDLNDKIKRLEEIIRKLNNENIILMNENLELKNINKNLLYKNESFIKDERELSLGSDNNNNDNNFKNEKLKTYLEILSSKSDIDIKSESTTNIKHYNSNNVEEKLKKI